MKLTNIKPIGRFVNPETGRPVNIKSGKTESGTEVIFYLYKNARKHLSQREFSSKWKEYAPKQKDPVFTGLIYNIKSQTFFESSASGDRWATAWQKLEKKFPKPLYYIVGQAIKFADWKGLLNAWIAPCGTVIPCGYQNHSGWAGDFLEEIGEEELAGIGRKYPYEVLHERDWVRLLNWSSKASEGKIYGDSDKPPKLTDQQKKSIEDWAAMNDVKFEDLFKY